MSSTNTDPRPETSDAEARGSMAVLCAIALGVLCILCVACILVPVGVFLNYGIAENVIFSWPAYQIEGMWSATLPTTFNMLSSLVPAAPLYFSKVCVTRSGSKKILTPFGKRALQLLAAVVVFSGLAYLLLRPDKYQTNTTLNIEVVQSLALWLTQTGLACIGVVLGAKKI